VTSTYVQVALAIAGLAIFAGLEYGYPGKELRGCITIVAVVIAAAFILDVLR
jgi:hypothetical protein